MTLHDWATKWGVSQAALTDLVTSPPPGPAAPWSEAAAQIRVRKRASELGWRLWRNNVGAYRDEHGGFVRYGLCNESARQNKLLKSSDLIGLKPNGQFVAIEVKRPGWRPGVREQAQGAFLALVRSLGGHAAFSTGEL